MVQWDESFSYPIIPYLHSLNLFLPVYIAICKAVFVSCRDRSAKTSQRSSELNLNSSAMFSIKVLLARSFQLLLAFSCILHSSSVSAQSISSSIANIAQCQYMSVTWSGGRGPWTLEFLPVSLSWSRDSRRRGNGIHSLIPIGVTIAGPKYIRTIRRSARLYHTSWCCSTLQSSYAMELGCKRNICHSRSKHRL